VKGYEKGHEKESVKRYVHWEHPEVEKEITL
jgi:hypothetical protein